MAGVVLREQEERDAAAIVALRLECDDSTVLSEAGWLHYRRHMNPRERSLGLVAASYGLPQRSLGAVSVIGPLRMDYGRAIRSVREAALQLSSYVADVYDER